MFILNGVKINIHQDLTIGEGDDAVTYPAGGLQNAGLRDELGITEEPDPVRPDDRLYFVTENPDGTYATTPRPLEQVTEPVWEQIKAKRDAVASGGVLVSGKWYHSDSDSRIQFLALKQLGASIPAGLQWKTMDGSFVTMTQTLANNIFLAMVTLDTQAFANAEVHKAAMVSATNPFDYDYSAGWPEIYEDTLI